MKLYDGSVDLTFSANAHRYKVDGRAVEGVTTILSRVISKDGLINWSAGMAAQAMYDAYNETLSLYGEVTAMDMKNAVEDARKAHTRRKVAGGDVGSLVHKACEDYIRMVMTTGRSGDVPDLENEQASRAFEAFLEWDTTNQPKYIDSERVVYSKSQNYCGTFDLSFELNGKRYLADFKTSDPKRQWLASKKRYGGYMAYPEHWLQVAAYDFALNEETNQAFDAYMIIYITKSGKLHTFTRTDTDVLKLGWRHAVNISRLLRTLA